MPCTQLEQVVLHYPDWMSLRAELMRLAVRNLVSKLPMFISFVECALVVIGPSLPFSSFRSCWRETLVLSRDMFANSP